MEIMHARENNATNTVDELGVIIDFHRYNNVLSMKEDAMNDFELQISIAQYNISPIYKEDWIYIPNTEWGGVVNGIENIDGIVKLTGKNFRGRLADHLIFPKPMETTQGKWNNRVYDYITSTNKDANEYIKSLYFLSYSKNGTSNITDDNVAFNSESAGKNITDSVRFSNYLTHITKILRENGLRLETKHVYHNENKPILYQVSAKKAVDYSNSTVINHDYDLEITSKSDSVDKKTYCICLGRGEMQDREIIILARNESGVISQVEPFYLAPDFLSNSIFYDNANVENTDELIAGGIKYLEDNNEVNTISFEIINNSMEFYLGDKIGGADEITGVKGVKEIIEKELTIDSDGERIEYRINE